MKMKALVLFMVVVVLGLSGCSTVQIADLGQPRFVPARASASPQTSGVAQSFVAVCPKGELSQRADGTFFCGVARKVPNDVGTMLLGVGIGAIIGGAISNGGRHCDRWGRCW